MLATRLDEHPLLSADDRGKLTELRAHLVTVRLDECRQRPYMRETLASLSTLLRTEKVLAYDLEPTSPQTFELGFWEVDGFDNATVEPLVREYLLEVRGRFGLFDPACPEPSQRNRAMTWTREDIADLVRRDASPMAKALFPRIGAGSRAQLRALVCDGPSLLGWVGAFQEAPFDARHVAILQSLVPALQQRLRHERLLSDGHRKVLVSATLDAVAAPVMVVTSRGRILEANAAARSRIDADPRRTREEIHRSVRRGGCARWTVAPLTLRGQPPAFIVTPAVKADESLGVRVARLAERWHLTKRQSDVLEKLAEGNANRTIAAMLGISPRTVEVHVTALLEKAGAESRSELVARVLTSS